MLIGQRDSALRLACSATARVTRLSNELPIWSSLKVLCNEDRGIFAKRVARQFDEEIG